MTDYYFDEFWQALNEEQRAVLTALAKGEAVPKELHAAAAGLLRKEVLAQESGCYALRVPLLGRWVVDKSVTPPNTLTPAQSAAGG